MPDGSALFFIEVLIHDTRVIWVLLETKFVDEEPAQVFPK
jgi:hypothetical protein